MSRTLPTNFQTYNAIAQKNPRVIMSIDGIDDRTYSSGDFLYENETYVLDNFNDIDTTNLSSHSPDIGGSWTVERGVSEITNNEAEVTSNATFQAYQDDIGEDDSIITIKAYHSSAGGADWTLGGMLRRDDINNHIIIALETSEGTDLFRIYEEFPSPPYSNIIYEDTPGSALQDDTEYTFVITLSGSSISVSVSGGGLSESEGGTLTNFTTGGEHGLYASGDDDIFFTYFSITSGLSEQDPNNNKYIQSFEADFLNIDVKEGRTVGGQSRCVLIDKDLDVSEYLIVDNNTHEVDINFKLGYKEIAENDFVNLETQRIKTIKLPSVNTIEFLTEDVRRLIGRDREVFNFRQHTTLSADLAASDTTATVVSTTGFVDPDDLWTSINWIYPVLIIEDTEAAWYEDINSSTEFDFDTTTDRARGGTPRIAHDSGAEVRQGVMFMRIPGNDDSGPVQPLIAMMLTRRNSTDSSTHAYYDLINYSNGFLGFGLGMTSSEVNILSFERADALLRTEIEDKSADSISKCYVSNKPVRANDFFAEYLKNLGLFVYVDRNGKIAVKNYDYLELAFNYSADATLGNDDIQDGSFEIGYEDIVNFVELSYGMVPLSGNYDTVRQFQQDESQAAYGLTADPYLLKHDFFTASINDQEITNGYLRRFMYLFANPPGNFKITVPTENIGIAVGDFVTLTFDRFKDFTGSSTVQGWTAKKSLITGQRIIWSGGRPEMELEGFTWELMDKADLSGISANVIDGGDWDDSDCDLEISTDTGNTTTREAADAYYDEDAIEGEVFRLEIQLTLPTSPINPSNDPVPSSDSRDTVMFDLALHLQDSVSDPTASDVFTSEVKGIRYDAGYGSTSKDPNLQDVEANSDGWNLVFYFTSDSGSLTWDRIKVDTYNCRYAADGRDVGSGNRADVDIVSFTRYGLSTISISEIT